VPAKLQTNPIGLQKVKKEPAQRPSEAKEDSSDKLLSISNVSEDAPR